MSEADRVFARMTTPGSHHPAPEDKQVLHITTRRRGAAAGQSRIVEVVHRRSDRTATPTAPASPPAQSVHAATWPEGFPARPASTLPPADSPAATPDPAPPVGHVMPGWEPLLAPVQPNAPAAEPTASTHRQLHAAKPPIGRSFADPFAADDTGANCIRCGYLVEPAREQRGLLTCHQCR
jgi:hypothetical protein